VDEDVDRQSRFGGCSCGSPYVDDQAILGLAARDAGARLGAVRAETGGVPHPGPGRGRLWGLPTEGAGRVRGVRDAQETVDTAGGCPTNSASIGGNDRQISSRGGRGGW
jgi:hypothetical protein